MPPASRGFSRAAAPFFLKLLPWARLRLAVALLVLAAPLADGSGKTLSRIEKVPEVAVDQIREEEVLEAEYYRTKELYGVEDRRTLDAFFEVYELWIMLYRLNKIDNALKEVYPACMWRLDGYMVKAMQAKAFTRWKQGAFREALQLFHRMEDSLGAKSFALSENIGHTYNSIGKYDMAEQYFKEALQLTDIHAASDPDGGSGNKGGILMGLSQVQEKRGHVDEALTSAEASYKFYREKDTELGWRTSLTAKAAMMVAKHMMKGGNSSGAETYALEALQVFEHTAGEDSPLVIGPLETLAGIYSSAERWEEAKEALHRAYQVAGRKDALDLTQLLELHNMLVDANLNSNKKQLDRAAFKRYFPVVEAVVERVKREFKQDGNAGAYFKAAGEILVLGDKCSVGKPVLQLAIRLFKIETSIDTSGLVATCTDLVRYCDGEL